MKIVLSISLFLLSYCCRAQQFLIRYDLLNHQTTYFKIQQKDTLVVKEVDLPGSGQLLLQVDNYNPFYWNARITAIKDATEHQQSFADAFNPFSVLAGGMADLMGGLPLLDMPTSRGAISRDDYDAATFKFVSALNRYSTVYGRIQKLTERLDALQIARLQLQELKMSNSKAAVDIKTTAHALMKNVLHTDNPGLTTVLETGRTNDNSLSSLVIEGLQLAQEIKEQQPLIDLEKEFEDKSLKELAEMAVPSFTALNKLEEDQQLHPRPFTDVVAAVTNLYRDINAASFQFAYSVEFNDDISGVKVQLYAKENEGDATTDTLVKYFEVNKKKGVRIRNSLGVAFNHFSDNNRAFIIDNGIIKSGVKDLFTPVLSTFIHFYTGNSASFKWGGAFGFGIPLQGERKDVHFMLGLSAIIGRNEAVMLTAGISGARVNKLIGDYQTGSGTTETDIAKITTLGYSAGTFISISLNLNSIIKGK